MSRPKPTPTPDDTPYRYFCLWQPKSFINMPTHGWQQVQLKEGEFTPQLEMFYRMKRFAYVEDCATGDVVFSSLDLLRSMHIARTQWPARDKIYRLLKDAKPQA